MKRFAETQSLVHVYRESIVTKNTVAAMNNELEFLRTTKHT